jgi:hypothetical protein
MSDTIQSADIISAQQFAAFLRRNLSDGDSVLWPLIELRDAAQVALGRELERKRFEAAIVFMATELKAIRQSVNDRGRNILKVLADLEAAK